MDKIELTMGELLNGVQALNELMQMDLPILAALKVRRLAQLAAPELEVYNATHTMLRGKYLKEDGSVSDKEALEVEWKELIGAKLTLQMSPIQVSLFGDKLIVKPSTLIMLSKFLAD